MIEVTFVLWNAHISPVPLGSLETQAHAFVDAQPAAGTFSVHFHAGLRLLQSVSMLQHCGGRIVGSSASGKLGVVEPRAPAGAPLETRFLRTRPCVHHAACA